MVSAFNPNFAYFHLILIIGLFFLYTGSVSLHFVSFVCLCFFSQQSFCTLLFEYLVLESFSVYPSYEPYPSLFDAKNENWNVNVICIRPDDRKRYQG